MGVSTSRVARLLRDPRASLRRLHDTHPAWAVWLDRYLGLGVLPFDYPFREGLRGLPRRTLEGMDPLPAYLPPDLPEAVVFHSPVGLCLILPPAPPEPGEYLLAPLLPPAFLSSEELRPRFLKPFARVVRRL